MKGGEYFMASIINSAYDYYLTTYGSRQVSRYDSHKKEDLRNTVNKINKINKESPLYKVRMSRDVQKFAIDIKESARNIKNIVASLSETDAGIGAAFDKKIAISSQPDVATAEYIGDDSDVSVGFELEVRQLATPQVNVGNFLKRNSRDFATGSYSFDLNTNSNSYEFQYNINAEDTNEDVLRKLGRLVNNSNIGLKADIINGGSEMSALRIESKDTGLGENESDLFRIIPAATPDSQYAMRTLGIDTVAAPAENSSFLLNGVEHSSYSNTFTINNAFAVTLNGVSPKNTPAVIGFKPSADAVADDIQSLVDSFNAILETAEVNSGSPISNEKLLKDMGNIAKAFSENLEPIGLSVGDHGVIDIDRDALTRSVISNEADENIKVLNHFKDAIGRKADEASLDPMNYIKKILVTYKNPGKNFVTPYVSSVYSGMMMDQIC